MLLAIDIGNTSVSLAVLKGKRVVANYLIEQNASVRPLTQQAVRTFKRIKREYSSINSVIICSVVPKVLKHIESAVKTQWAVTPIIVGRDIKVPIGNKYHNPKQVGQDRLVCAYAAKVLYGAPTIVIDLGTAITFDVVSAKGNYEGGMIVPGIRLSAEALFQKTALLPRIDQIKSPKSLVGKNTRESILSGIFNGYGAMCSGLIDRVSKSMKGRAKVIVTGGYTHLMKKFIIHKIDKIEPNLVFLGLYLLNDRKQ